MVRWNKAYIKGTHQIVGIDDGLSEKLEYECMACGSAMIAKRGTKRIHHFAHKEKTVKCDPESYYHKKGKEIFKEVYDNSSIFIISPSSNNIDLKKEYGECKMEIREKGQILKNNEDLSIKHLKDENKDILVEIFYSHQVDKNKIDKSNRIIEIRIPINFSQDEDIDSNDVESRIMKICTPPLHENDFIRFYNFDQNVIYHEVQSSNITHSVYSDEDCLGTDNGRKYQPKFRNYTISHQTGQNNKQSDKNDAVGNINIEFSIDKQNINEKLLQPRMEAIRPTIYFDVDCLIKNKYPNIRHQPAVLPNNKNIIDIIITDNGKEFWLGIDYRKREIFEGDLDRKIPEKWKEAVREYIRNLKQVNK